MLTVSPEKLIGATLFKCPITTLQAQNQSASLLDFADGHKSKTKSDIECITTSVMWNSACWLKGLTYGASSICKGCLVHAQPSIPYIKHEALRGVSHTSLSTFWV